MFTFRSLHCRVQIPQDSGSNVSCCFCNMLPHSCCVARPLDRFIFVTDAENVAAAAHVTRLISRETRWNMQQVTRHVSAGNSSSLVSDLHQRVSEWRELHVELGTSAARLLMLNQIWTICLEQENHSKVKCLTLYLSWWCGGQMTSCRYVFVLKSEKMSWKPATSFTNKHLCCD